MTVFLPRSAWTSTPNPRKDRPLAPSEVEGIAVHYPASGNVSFADLSQDEVSARLRGWRDFHVNGRGWADIGYCYGIDQAGRVWVLAGNTIAAHSGSVSNPQANRHWIGVLFIVGDNEDPTVAAIAAFRDLRKSLRSVYTQAQDIKGHYRIPGASTACPGAPLKALIDSGALADVSEQEPPKPVDYMDPKNYGTGKTGPQVTWLGERLVAHGYAKHYSIGPGPTWGEADRLNVRDFQLAQGWIGSGADGYPGPLTLKRLAEEVPMSSDLNYLTLNVIATHLKAKPDPSDKYDQKGLDYRGRLPLLAAIVRESGASVVGTQESGGPHDSALLATAIGPTWDSVWAGESESLGLGILYDTTLESIQDHGYFETTGPK